MLRFLYTTLALLAGIMAILSPIAILHWLMTAVGHPSTTGVVEALNPFFSPLNSLLSLILPLPDLYFQGRAVPTTQGALAALLTLGFFALTYLSESLKALEQRLDVTQKALAQRVQMQRLQAQAQQERKKISGNRRILVHVQYDFQNFPPGSTPFEAQYATRNGKVLQTWPDSLGLEFDTLENALQYSLDTSQSVLSHYATLRPMDPQPPYRLAIHVVPPDWSPQDGLLQCSYLSQFAAPNQVVFSQDTLQLMDALGIQQNYHHQSLGMYALNQQNIELFRLYYQKRQQGFR